MAHDLIIRNGLIADGIGSPAYLGDVAIDAGRIAAVVPLDKSVTLRDDDGTWGKAKEEFDAQGCWVTPGFIDPHTHLDAQLCWDPAAAPSNRHGVTTVILGLCGFGVAPCTGRIWQINVETKFSHDAAALIQEVERYAEWSRRAGARLTWTPFYAEPGETVWQEVLDHNRRLNESGVEVSPQITAVPITLLLRFEEGSFLTAIPGWADALRGFFKLSLEERKARLLDPTVREAMKIEGVDPKHPLNPDFNYWTFTLCPSRPELSGRSLAEAALHAGVHPVDLLCDQVVRDDLQTLIDIPIFNRSEEGVVRFLEDPYTLLGLGDAGAHVMSVTNYRYPTFLLANLVAQKQALALELAINRMTQVPARLHGLRDRGTLAPGMAADVCVIDPERLQLGPVEVRHDLPGHAPRLYQAGIGYHAVFVNGTQTIENDEPTGAAPGEMLRA